MNTMLNFYQLEQGIEAKMRESHIPGLALAIVQESCRLHCCGCQW